MVLRPRWRRSGPGRRGRQGLCELSVVSDPAGTSSQLDAFKAIADQSARAADQPGFAPPGAGRTCATSCTRCPSSSATVLARLVAHGRGAAHRGFILPPVGFGSALPRPGTCAGHGPGRSASSTQWATCTRARSRSTSPPGRQRPRRRRARRCGARSPMFRQLREPATGERAVRCGRSIPARGGCMAGGSSPACRWIGPDPEYVQGTARRRSPPSPRARHRSRSGALAPDVPADVRRSPSRTVARSRPPEARLRRGRSPAHRPLSRLDQRLQNLARRGGEQAHRSAAERANAHSSAGQRGECAYAVVTWANARCLAIGT